MKRKKPMLLLRRSKLMLLMPRKKLILLLPLPTPRELQRNQPKPSRETRLRPKLPRKRRRKRLLLISHQKHLSKPPGDLKVRPGPPTCQLTISRDTPKKVEKM